MPFLRKTDYDTVIRNDRLDVVLNEDPSLLTGAEMKAESQMSDYLNQRFDVAAIFSAFEPDRNHSIVMYMVDITLYHLHSRINPRNVPELRERRYEDALKWLKMVADGKLTPDLPPLETDNYGQRWGSNPKMSHRY